MNFILCNMVKFRDLTDIRVTDWFIWVDGLADWVDGLVDWVDGLADLINSLADWNDRLVLGI